MKLFTTLASTAAIMLATTGMASAQDQAEVKEATKKPAMKNESVNDGSKMKEMKKDNSTKKAMMKRDKKRQSMKQGSANRNAKMKKGMKTTMVGGAEMYPNKNIVQNASQSEDHTTLVAAVKAAELAGTLSGEGPFTVFAPTNDAFNALPEGTVDTLLKPENREKLSAILTYHVLPGNFTAQILESGVHSAGGMTNVKTVNGTYIKVKLVDGKVVLIDQAGNSAHITIADVTQSNGIVHVIDTVLLPSK